MLRTYGVKKMCYKVDRQSNKLFKRYMDVTKCYIRVKNIRTRKIHYRFVTEVTNSKLCSIGVH
jgi:hypothetical protein